MQKQNAGSRRQVRAHSLVMACMLPLMMAGAASAATITESLGNTSPCFSDGDKPPLIDAPCTILSAQSGRPAPFDSGKGTDAASNLDESWSFSYGAVSGTILSASLTLGIIDHDSAAAGSQLASFFLDGNNLTGGLNALLEGRGGSDGEYNVYTLTLDSGLFAALADGSLLVNLALTGPGLQTALPFLGGGVSETTYNGAFLIFSTLSITTRDDVQVPEPGSLALLGIGLLAMAGSRRRRGAGRL